jgi:hypothetical protein
MLKQLQAKYELFDGVEDMLTPKTMSKILKRNVAYITCQPFEEAKGASNSQFHLVTADEQRFVMKHTHTVSDWVSLGSIDTRYRSVRLWQYGVLDHLRPVMEHVIVAACCDGDDYVLLMRDVSPGVVKLGQELTLKTVRSLLNAFAAMHAMYWEDEGLSNPELGLCNVNTFMTAFWPILSNQNRYDMTGIENEWAILFDRVEPDVLATIQSLIANPKTLFDKLAEYPSTLVHGDFRPGNIAILPETNQLVTLDWQLAGFAPAVIELHWFLNSYDTVTPFDGIAYYRQQLALQLGKRFDASRWQSMLEIGYLAAVLRLGWALADGGIRHGFKFWLSATSDFNDIVRQGVRWL